MSLLLYPAALWLRTGEDLAKAGLTGMMMAASWPFFLAQELRRGRL